MFVSFEGPEGAGKTTLMRALAGVLESRGLDVALTREPGEGEVGQAIREILLHGGALDRRAELFLFLADRAQHVESFIRPALARGACVLCDRYGDSTVVYQGYGRGLELGMLREWNDFATSGLSPDATLLLDLPPEAGLARITQKNRLDAESLSFHKRIRQGFLEEAKRDPKRWRVIDAEQSPDAVLQEALAFVEERLTSRDHN